MPQPCISLSPPVAASLLQVFGPKSSQKQLYHGAISPIVLEVLEGFNCTVFAYGQTGTGKTYTMEGGDRKSIDGVDLSDAAGVIPRAIKEIFDNLEENAIEHSVKVLCLCLFPALLIPTLNVPANTPRTCCHIFWVICSR